MKFLAVIICALTSFVQIAASNQSINADAECVFTLGNNLSPLLLDSDNTTLKIPRNGRVVFKKDAYFTVFCPTTKAANYWGPTKSAHPNGLNAALVRCAGGNKVIFQNKEYVIDDKAKDSANCVNIVEGTVIDDKKSCGDKQGQLYKIGYYFGSSECFMPLVKVCYLKDNFTTVSTLHILHGEDIAHVPTNPPQSGYKQTFAPGVDAAYQKPSQTKIFQQLLSDSKLITDNSYLMEGHLTPYLDFVTVSTQYSSKDYITVVPIWRTILKGNWRRVEGMIRQVADFFRDPFFIYSGTYEVLALTKDGKPVEIYLMENKRLPVPKFLYKIMYYKPARLAIVLVVLNNPNDQGSNDWCKGGCEKYEWASKDFASANLGLTRCCTYQDFVKKVPNAPSIEVRGVLIGPNKQKKTDFYQDFELEQFESVYR